MGTEYNAAPWETENATFLEAKNIPFRAKALRAILRGAMEGAGFVNYPPEWWHWSYGDRYWAVVAGEDCAVYGPVSV